MNSDRQLELDYLRRARENLRPFEEWLRTMHGYDSNQASLIAALICRATWESAQDGLEPDPVNLLDRDIPHYQWYRLRAALRQYYAWLLVTDSSKRSYYQRQAVRVQIARRSKLSVQPAFKTTDSTIRLVSQQEYTQLLQGVKRWCGKHGRSDPWVWPIISMHLKLTWRLEQLFLLTYDNLSGALKRGRKYGTISALDRIYVGKKRESVSKTITAPLKLIYHEVEQLVLWPWDWNVVSEIVVHPKHVKKDERKILQYEIRRANTVLNKYLRANLPKDMREIDVRASRTRLRRAAYVWMLSKLGGDWLALGQVIGKSLLWMTKQPDLLEVGSEKKPLVTEVQG